MTDKLQKTENVANNVTNEILQHLPQDFNKFIEENYDTSQSPRNGSQEGDLTSQWVNIYKSKKHGSYWSGAFCYKTKEEAVKDLADKENYLTTVNIEDMLNLQTQNAQLKKQINHLLKTQARQFVDNQNLQIKAEKAKYVVDLDAVRQIKQLKAKNDDFKKIIEYMIDELVDPNDDVSLGLAEYFSQDLINEIYEVLK